jgi:hypothetical protein
VKRRFVSSTLTNKAGNAGFDPGTDAPEPLRGRACVAFRIGLNGSSTGTQADELEAAVAAFSAATTGYGSWFNATRSLALLPAMHASNDVLLECAA